jgi:hypothetical protein
MTRALSAHQLEQTYQVLAIDVAMGVAGVGGRLQPSVCCLKSASTPHPPATVECAPVASSLVVGTGSFTLA